MEDFFWNKHYQTFRLQEASNFAKYCLDYQLDKNDTLIELGCGNGRDGLLIGKHVSRYIGIDCCKEAITVFEKSIEELATDNVNNIEAFQEDFTNINFNLISNKCKRVAIYSRFTLHSINYNESDRLFNNISQINLPWIMMLEVRTIFDPLYGDGKNLGLHEFKTDHYRRFIDPDVFISDVAKKFSVLYFEVGTGFAPYEGNEPLILRAVIQAKKIRK
jgi:tellurite methyltransferase